MFVCPRCEQPPPDGNRCPAHDLYAVEEDALAYRASAPLLGRLVADRYALVGFVGVGGMGVVYKALQVKVRRLVALKVLNPEYSRTEVVRKRFEREAAAMARLESPHVVTLYDYGFDPAIGAYMAMELVNGQSLADRLESHGPLSPARVADVLDGAAKALAEAHDKGVVHRDIKPGNILLSSTAEGRPFARVIDFGIARLDDATRTRTGLAAGTPEYMAPEQCNPKVIGQPDARTDVYGLAATAFAALTGRPPFQGDSAMHIMIAKVKQGPPSLPRQPALDPYDPVLLRGMARKADDRYPDPLAFAAAFRDVLEGRAGPVGPSPLVRGLRIGAPVGLVLLALGVVLARSPGEPGGAPDAAVAPVAAAGWPPVVDAAPPPVDASRRPAADAAPEKDAMVITPEDLAAFPEPSLQLATTPGAQVLVDGRPVGVAAAETGELIVPLDPSTAHRIEIRKDGHEAATLELPTVAWLGGNPRRSLELTARSSAPKARVQVERPAVSGACSATRVWRAAKRRVRALRRCQAAWRKASPKPQAFATLRFGISPRGGAINADIADSTLGDRATERCLTRTIQTIRFPKPKRGLCQVSMAITLRR